MKVYMRSGSVPRRCTRSEQTSALVCLALLSCLLWSSLTFAQQPVQDRRDWIEPGTTVSDDPRRIPVASGPHGPEGAIVLRGGRVFDGVSGAARLATVVIERNRIVAVLPPTTTDWPAGARVIDVAGGTVMPGLIDLHTHLTNPEPGTPRGEAEDANDAAGAAALRGVERLRYFAESGITSVRDVASHGAVPFQLKRWVAENRIPGPRVFAAGQLITATGGHAAESRRSAPCRHDSYGAIREASGPDDWREAVREQFKRGADLIKLASHYSREEVTAAVEEAHALGLKVTVDAETFYIQWAVQAGADVIEHPLPRTDETIRLMARNGTASVPTLVPYIYIFDTRGGYFDSTSRRFSFSREANLEMLRKLKRAGVKLGVGTDLVKDWFRHLPHAYITELEQFVAAGFTVPQALVAATRTSAEILDMADKLGTLEAGKLADVIVVNGRPDESLRDLAKVSLVIRDGHVIVEGGRVRIDPHIPVPEPRPAQVTLADYERAALFQNAAMLVSRTRLQPNWIARSDRFWYRAESGSEETATEFVVVDPERNWQGPAFDHVKLAAGLSTATGAEYKATALPFDWFVYVDSERAIRFRVREADWRCELRTYACAADVTTAGARDGETLSPDGRWAVSVLAHNLQVRDTRTGEERALTRDGRVSRAYGVTDTMSPITQRMLRIPSWPTPEVSFSPDSRYLLTYRADVSQVKEQAVIQTVPGARPITHSYHYPIAGDAQIPQVEMFLIDLEMGAVRRAEIPAFGVAFSRDMTLCWSEDVAHACFTESERGYKAVKLHMVDTATGRVHTPVIDSTDTYISRGSQARIVGDDLIWSSERDGWNHLYRIDARSGQMIRQLTRGEWAVREVVHVDTNAKQIYFIAGGREPGEDPYYRHLYRVDLDGSNLRHLSPESADHAIRFSPTGRYFIDTHSRLDQPPVSVLRRADGQLVRELQRADVGRLKAAGWKPARTLKFKASDGRTELYGAMFVPSNFDPKRRYPVLDSIYPGPQTIQTPKAFDVGAYEDELALAELGFVVVTLDGLGTPLRSKGFRDVSYRNMGAAGGLEDHIAGLRQLAQEYPWLDLDRVGIYGHSGGGYASTRALLKFPEFYKVAVSSAGNHDQRSYWAEWGERYHDWPVHDASYVAQANPPLASNLQGKLLLAHGDMDDNVHPTHTMQMVDALIAANRDFDLLILPNRDHGLVNAAQGKQALRGTDPYFLRRRWDYFVRHLLDAEPPTQFDLASRLRSPDK